jgi:hypothetical protein
MNRKNIKLPALRTAAQRQTLEKKWKELEAHVRRAPFDDAGNARLITSIGDELIEIHLWDRLSTLYFKLARISKETRAGMKNKKALPASPGKAGMRGTAASRRSRNRDG